MLQISWKSSEILKQYGVKNDGLIIENVNLSHIHLAVFNCNWLLYTQK